MIPILFVGILAALLIGLAVFMIDLSPAARNIIGMVGLICLFVFALLVWSYIQYISLYNSQAREATTMRKMELVARMNDKQLAALEKHAIRVELNITPLGVEEWYVSPMMDLSPEVVREMTVYCLEWPAFPNLPAQFGLSGWEGEEREWRDTLKAYTDMVVLGGLAEPAAGNQPAKWLVKRKDIVGLLGLAT